jgi:hypothetical protein
LPLILSVPSVPEEASLSAARGHCGRHAWLGAPFVGLPAATDLEYGGVEVPHRGICIDDAGMPHGLQYSGGGDTNRIA